MTKLPPGRSEPRRVAVTSADVFEDGSWQPMRLRPAGFQQGAAEGQQQSVEQMVAERLRQPADRSIHDLFFRATRG